MLEQIESPHTLYQNQLPPGAGTTQFIMNELGDFPWTVLSMFTGSGDNFVASHILAEAVFKIFNRNLNTKWLAPKSWNTLYQPENQNYVNDQEIYS